MVSQSRIWGAREEALRSLEVVGLELMAEGIMAGTLLTVKYLDVVNQASF